MTRADTNGQAPAADPATAPHAADGSGDDRVLDPLDPDSRDVEFIERYGRPFVDALTNHWFRVRSEGTEHWPEPGTSFIGVGIHSGGSMLADVWPILSLWWESYPLEQPAHALVHDMFFRIPGLRDAILRLGALRASRVSAERVLDRGGQLLIFPGGDAELYRSWRQRNVVDLRGRTAFVELAMTYGVPIIPIVNVGGHETLVTLSSSEVLARWTGLARTLRMRRVPVQVGLPWGIWATGFLPHLPLPASITYRTGEPIEVPHAPDLVHDRRLVRHYYDRTQQSMQSMVDDLARARRFPVVG